MKIGIPKETKVHEGRVAVVPAGVRQLRRDGHTVLIESGAGEVSGIADAQFREAGAVIVRTAQEVWGAAEMICKVKEPTPAEQHLLEEGQILFTYLHLAAVPELVPVLLEKRITAVAYETIELPNRRLPLLEPMSQVAGKMSVQIGARLLESGSGGKGVLLGGVAGVRRGRVVILGGGTVGLAAAKVAMGVGAHVTVIDLALARLEYLDDMFGARLQLLHSNPDTIAAEVRSADLLIGAVLVPGAKAPVLVPRTLVEQMEQGSVIVDVAIDQGGCVETIRGTTHENPTYLVADVVHYGVTNMPGAVAHTSTYALTNATISCLRRLASLGPLEAARADAALALGINTFDGRVTHRAVAQAVGHEVAPLPL